MRDLEKIQAYVAKEAANSATAWRWIGELLQRCDGLATFPERFAVYPHAPSWRMMPCGSYLIFFRAQADVVQIGHVRHGARKPFKR